MDAVLSRGPAGRRTDVSLRERFLSINERIWDRLPAPLMATRPVRAYGRFLHGMVTRGSRKQAHGTFFLRNRPEMELLQRLAAELPKGATLRLTVLACSNGAEVYSFVWSIRSVRPDLELIVHALDISSEIVQVAKDGLYSSQLDERIDENIFERMTADEIASMFDREGDDFRVKPWLKEGIDWRAGDAGDPRLAAEVGPQDIVVANRFLCHMDPADAEACLRSVVRWVKPGGHLFVSGVDLGVRYKVARDLRWTPVRTLLEEIHDGDSSVRGDWPWRYWGLEPLDRTRRDWATRYAAVFQIG